MCKTMQLLPIPHSQQDFQLYVTFSSYQNQPLNDGAITGTVPEGCGDLTHDVNHVPVSYKKDMSKI